MPSRLYACAALLAAAATVHASQDQQKKKDDRPVITVTGCVDKGYLHVRAADTVGSYAERYRLRGSKQLLKEIADKFAKHELEVTGASKQPRLPPGLLIS